MPSQRLGIDLTWRPAKINFDHDLFGRMDLPWLLPTALPAMAVNPFNPSRFASFFARHRPAVPLWQQHFDHPALIGNPWNPPPPNLQFEKPQNIP